MEKNSEIKLEVLSKEKFDSNSTFYIESFNAITLSIYPDLEQWQLEDWNAFFDNHPINSIVFLMVDSQIVSFMYATPNRDYASHREDNSLKHWGIKYIQTYLNCQRKGYGYRVMLFGIKDMIEKGAQKVSALPNEQSVRMFENIAKEFNLSVSQRIGTFTFLDINKIDKTLQKQLTLK